MDSKCSPFLLLALCCLTPSMTSATRVAFSTATSLAGVLLCNDNHHVSVNVQTRVSAGCVPKLHQSYQHLIPRWGTQHGFFLPGVWINGLHKALTTLSQPS